MGNHKALGAVPSNGGPRINALKARYRSRWDAHQLIADNNSQLLLAGKQPSNEQLINELCAAEAVRLASDELRRELPPGEPSKASIPRRQRISGARTGDPGRSKARVPVGPAVRRRANEP